MVILDSAWKYSRTGARALLLYLSARLQTATKGKYIDEYFRMKV